MRFRRILNLIRRMMNGKEELYTNASPRITHEEIKTLEALGFHLQTEHTYGAQAGPITIYPLHQGDFDKRAIEILPSLEHHAKHGDMDGKTCLLAKCALHYPEGTHQNGCI